MSVASVIWFNLGLLVLLINKLRYRLFGYRQPRPFSAKAIEKAIAYDHHVVEQWVRVYEQYTGTDLRGKTVLELGPGADLGAAFLLLDLGVDRYCALDAHQLIGQTSRAFYEQLIDQLQNPQEWKERLSSIFAGSSKYIDYRVDPTFDLRVFQHHSIDVVFSQAAMEHMSDLPRIIDELTQIVSDGAVLIAEVDLMTHTGVLRTRDPLNIYRFPSWLYRLFSFIGIPNRMRPNQYKDLFEQYGWSRVEIIPLQTLSEHTLARVQRTLDPEFRSKSAQMEILSFLICATK